MTAMCSTEELRLALEALQDVLQPPSAEFLNRAARLVAAIPPPPRPLSVTNVRGAASTPTALSPVAWRGSALSSDEDEEEERPERESAVAASSRSSARVDQTPRAIAKRHASSRPAVDLGQRHDGPPPAKKALRQGQRLAPQTELQHEAPSCPYIRTPSGLHCAPGATSAAFCAACPPTSVDGATAAWLWVDGRDPTETSSAESVARMAVSSADADAAAASTIPTAAEARLSPVVAETWAASLVPALLHLTACSAAQKAVFGEVLRGPASLAKAVADLCAAVPAGGALPAALVAHVAACTALPVAAHAAGGAGRLAAAHLAALLHCSSKRTGKWMIFVSPDRIDAVWHKVAVACEAGKLGVGCKVPPARGVPEKSFLPVIVYTHDADDAADVLRVLRGLRALGVEGRLVYKTDAFTRLGLYAAAFTGSACSHWVSDSGTDDMHRPTGWHTLGRFKAGFPPPEGAAE